MDLRSLFKTKDQLTKQKGEAVERAAGPVATRIAPSPTGPLHIGTARSALFNFLFARKHKGRFIIRIEDTDKARNKKEFEEDILEGLQWLGLAHDEIYRQSEREDIYRRYIAQLLDSGHAYVSKEKSKAEPDKTVEVVRLRNPNTTVSFDDMLRGGISFDTTELGDFVIARSVSDPLYHLAVVVDDYDMNITHVIRGEDHISNTPRQILIQEALGFPRPYYAHIPLILTAERAKMSKRDGASMLIRDLQKKEYMPEAVLNYLALLGWNPGGDRELYTLVELVEAFDIAQIQRSGAVFNREKLDWFNSRYLKRMSKPAFKRAAERILSLRMKDMPGYNRKILERLIPTLQEKIQTLDKLKTTTENGEVDYFFQKPAYDPQGLIREKDADALSTKTHLENVMARLEYIPTGGFTDGSVKYAVWNYADEEGRGAVLWPMRFALCGQDKSPDPFTLAYILGKKETLERLAEAAKKLEKLSQ